MQQYLKQFATHSAYEAVKSNLDTPNVVLCTQEDEVHYNPYVDPFNGHAYIDLGLPSGTLWATMNVGANSVTDYGNYYMYGAGSKTYDSTDTPYAGTEDPLATSADTATQVWGGDWHMPTKTQIEELIANTTYQWVTDYNGSGINGGTFTATNGNSVFFPASGFMVTNINSNNSMGMYYSSTPYNDVAYYLVVYTGGGNIDNTYTSRTYGYSVRPVIG